MVKKAPPVTVYSKVSVKSQTVLPRDVRKRLGVSAGDRLRYVLDENGVRLEKAAPAEGFDPFASFSEWSGSEDEEAFANLR